MTLFMLELLVADADASAAWYRQRLGLRELLRDDANGFLLLQAPGGGRVALKRGEPRPGGARLHFEVTDLAAVAGDLPVKVSDEGYRSVSLADPDGYAVTLFEWSPGRRQPDCV